jgi:hypothetical protein
MSIEGALGRSEYLLVMLSPDAARSQWVRREVECFARNHSRDKIGFILTAGTTRWTDVGVAARDVEIESLVDEYVDVDRGAIPLLIDLRPFRQMAKRASLLRDPRFVEHVASVAAWLQGKSKDEVYGDHIARQRLEKWILVGVVAALLVLVVVAQAQALRAETARQDERSNGAALLAAQPGREIEALEQGIGVMTWALEHDLALWAMTRATAEPLDEFPAGDAAGRTPSIARKASIAAQRSIGGAECRPSRPHDCEPECECLRCRSLAGWQPPVGGGHRR